MHDKQKKLRQFDALERLRALSKHNAGVEVMHAAAKSRDAEEALNLARAQFLLNLRMLQSKQLQGQIIDPAAYGLANSALGFLAELTDARRASATKAKHDHAVAANALGQRSLEHRLIADAAQNCREAIWLDVEKRNFQENTDAEAAHRIRLQEK